MLTGNWKIPTLLLDLPAIPDNGRGEHNGGKIRIGPDNNVYYVIGEVGGHRTQAQNNENGPEPMDLGVYLESLKTVISSKAILYLEMNLLLICIMLWVFETVSEWILIR